MNRAHKTNEALVGLVDSVQQMVKHMRSEQEITRQQLEASGSPATGRDDADAQTQHVL